MKKYMLPNILVAVVLMISAIVMPVLAANPEEETYSLTVAFVTRDRTLSGVEFRIYDAFDDEGKLKGAFAELGIDGSGLGSDLSGELAFTLAAYAARDDIPPYETKVTGANGRAVFSDLPKGIYLIVGDTVTSGEYIYTPQPFILAVPYTTDEGELVADVVAENKYDRRVFASDPVSRSVEKVWADDERSQRSESVTIQLLKNGKVYDTVELNDDNDWSYTWDDLDPNENWLVVEEEVPDGYKVRISQENELFTVTNTGAPDETGDDDDSEDPSSTPDVDDPSSPDSTTSSSQPAEPSESSSPSESSRPTDVPDSSSPSSGDSGTSSATADSSPKPAGPATPTNSAPPTLPQTGQLWWPVPVMFLSGAVLLLAGLVVSKMHEENA